MKIIDIYKIGYKKYQEKKYQEAFEIFLELARKEHIESQLMVGNMLILGIGINKNKEEGYFWYKIAAKNGNEEAQYIIGWYYIQSKKYELGIKYLCSSSKKNFLDATYDLAGFYYYGMNNCVKNLKKAFYLYEKAFLSGKKEALKDLLYVKVEEVGKIGALVYFLKNIFKYLRKIRGRYTNNPGTVY